jgi:prepilin-type N-terminal cleavage/methylation domain-containing protein
MTVQLRKYFKNGFTLIELLLVIAILSILLVVVFASLNPAQRLSETRDARRTNDSSQLLTAIHQCLVDNDGSFTTCGLTNPQSKTQIGTCASGGATLCSGAEAACDADLSTALSGYIASVPQDPSVGSAETTGYSVTVADGIVTIDACAAENSTISVAR